MFRNAKKSVKAELVLDIAVREVKHDTQYQGQIMGFGVPLKFEVVFKIPLGMLEFYVKVGEEFQAPTRKIADVLNQTLKNRYELKIVREDDKPIDAPPEELKAVLFQPIAMAIGLLQGKPGTSEATFHIPCLAAEEMDQFRSPDELQEYVLSLNR
jgi:hypothetical protein